MSTDHPFADSVAAYSLGALDADERRTFEAHLSTCARCQAELHDLRRVAVGIGIAVPSEEPPASLRARTLAFATSQPQEPGASTAPMRGSAAMRPAEAVRRGGQTGVSAEASAKAGLSAGALAKADRSATGVLDRPRDKGPLPRWVPLAIAASLGLAVLTGIYAGLLSWQVSTLRQQAQDASDSFDRQREQLGAMQQEASRLAMIARIATAPDAKRVTLAGRDKASGASAHAIWSPTQGIVFNAERLPQLDPARVYQLWVLRADKPYSVGVFRVGTGGGASFTGAMPSNVASVDALAVSVEPDSGVTSPTGPIVLMGTSS